ncbi:glycoside hydrolase family 18 protein [Lentisphaerota bacterium WC36G]|nr:glycoside hydrolase family 18 protein [Lentisphaerae bacterium WC36]
MKKNLLMLCAFIASFTLKAKEINYKNHSPRPVVGSYYVEGAKKTLPPNKIKYQLLSHIFHAFAVPKDDGSITQISNDIVKEAHKNNTRVIISVGGGGYKKFAKITNNKKTYKNLIQSLILLVKNNDYDGIDIDWEFPENKIEGQNWNKLMTDLRSELDKLSQQSNRLYELTTALPVGKWCGKWISREVILKNIDFINLMAYDGLEWQAGYHSPLFADKNDPKKIAFSNWDYWWNENKIPKSKLTFGVPFYTYVFESIKPYTKLPNYNGGRQVAYQKFLNRMKKEGGYTSYESTENLATWYFSADKKVFAAVDTPKTIAFKTNWAVKKMKFTGVFSWALHHEYDKSNQNFPLTEAMKKASE